MANNENNNPNNNLGLLTSKKIKLIISLALVGLEILFGVLFIFFGLKEDLRGSNAIWNVYMPNYYADVKEMVFTGITALIALAILIAAGISLYKAIRRKKMLTVQITNTVMGLSGIIFSAIGAVTKTVFFVLSFIISLLSVAYLIFFYKVNKEAEKEEAARNKEIPAEVEEDDDDEIKNPRGGVIPAMVLMFIGLATVFLVFVLPVVIFDDKPLFKLFDIFSSENNDNLYSFQNEIKISLVTLIAFTDFFFTYMYIILDASKALTYSRHNPQRFYKAARKNLYLCFSTVIEFFVFSVFIEYFLYGQLNTTVEPAVKTGNISFIPLIIMGVVIIVQSILTGRYIKDESPIAKAKKSNRFITLGFTLLFIALLVGCVFSNIIIINIEFTGSSLGTTIEPITVNGFKIFNDSAAAVESHMQLFGFVIYAVFILAVIATVLTLATFVRKSKYFYKTSLITVITCFIGIVALALFSKYFTIANEVNKKTIVALAEHIVPALTSYEYEVQVESDCMAFLFGGLGAFALLAVFRPYTKQIKEEGLDVNINDLDELGEALSAAGGGSGGNGGGVGLSREDVSDAKSKDFDSCPAFSEIDGEEGEIKQDVEERRRMVFNNPTLPTLVRFIVDYAKESRLHLSYKDEDIAQFIAGLGSSKLSILQGMSGTGKTSLPKIFSEAILGNVNIIEVESSWKDKNELIGYFNEFSGKFTPKKFTQSLYRAAFYGDVITFIVLDEMNLSRIEYYFSDFLSLMENEPDKREIKLLNVQLKNFKSGVNVSYKQLKKGHTLKVSPNIWFIGTANRDESTFEISDKVYDRAMTMNFMKRAPKIDAYSEPIDQRFLDYPTFNALLEKACNSFKFDCSSDPTIRAVEKLLAPYNISFGNRIERQIEKFVSVYCSCFTDSEKMIPIAVEKILFSKVVAKLEFKSVENKEELAHSFEELGLMECASFINKLNGDL
ncbi:MAG: hypothetical protein K6E21_05315 [Bacilli bacterium]|nr:hypothetical protein [Bacilli bacterium]